LLHPQRDACCEHLKKLGIPTMIYYPKPLHLQTAYASMGHKLGDFPNSEKAAVNIFSLPFHPYLGGEEQDKVVQALLDFAKVAVG